MITEGLEIDYRPEALERLVLEYVGNRFEGRSNITLERKIEENSSAGLCRSEQGWRPTVGDEPWDAQYWFMA